MEDFDIFFVGDWLDTGEYSPEKDESITPLPPVQPSESQGRVPQTSTTAAASDERKRSFIDVRVSDSIVDDKVARRKRARRRAPVRPQKPVITKDDPRRFIINAVAATYNSSDVNAIWSFLTKYATEDIVFRTSVVGDVSDLMPAMQRPIVVQGRASFCEYWYAHAAAIPDDTMVIENTKLYVRSDGTSTIMSSVVLGGSPIVTNEMMAQMRANVAKPSTSSKPNNNGATIEENNVDAVIARILNRVGRAMSGITEHFSKSNAKTQLSKQHQQQVSSFHSSITVDNNSTTTATYTDVAASNATIFDLSQPLVVTASATSMKASSIESIDRDVTMTLHLNKDSKIELFEFAYSARKATKRSS